MDFYLVSVLVFACIIAILVYLDRKSFKRESIFLLRRTKFGSGFLKSVGEKFPRFWKVVGFFSVAIGFIVSVLGVKMLLDTLLSSIATKSSAPSLALLLPSPTAEPIFGYGYLAVPFWYWIICIALLALVHEGFHGIYAAREKVKIKSLGFGLLAVIPLAFVEPDEKKLAKKGTWPQLRVFSAGSFANFLLAALSMAIMILIISAAYVPAGVDFTSYPYSSIAVSSVTAVGGVQVNGFDSINQTISGFGENYTLRIDTANGTYFVKNKLLQKQMIIGTTQIRAFDDYPAAAAGLEGTIKAINGKEVSSPAGLSLALEEAGENKAIQIEILFEGELKNVTLTTASVADSAAFEPGYALPAFASLEQAVPGSIDFYLGSVDFIYGLSGDGASGTWSYMRAKQDMWTWVSDNYPSLKEMAAGKAAAIGAELEGRGKPGFIGIINVLPHYDLAPGLEPWEGPLGFSQGLLAFLIVINLGVGIVNLLPVKPLDGGKMWEIALDRYFPKQTKIIMKAMGYFILFLLLANFIPFGLLF